LNDDVHCVFAHESSETAAFRVGFQANPHVEKLGQSWQHEQQEAFDNNETHALHVSVAGGRRVISTAA
jgi:hypothetical protein